MNLLQCVCAWTPEVLFNNQLNGCSTNTWRWSESESEGSVYTPTIGERVCVCVRTRCTFLFLRNSRLNLMLQSEREPTCPYRELLSLTTWCHSQSEGRLGCFSMAGRLWRLGEIPTCEKKINCHHFLKQKTNNTSTIRSQWADDEVYFLKSESDFIRPTSGKCAVLKQRDSAEKRLQID